MTTETVLKFLEGWYDCDVPSEHDKKDDEAIRLIHARQKKLGSNPRAAIISILHEDGSPGAIKALCKILSNSTMFVDALYVYNFLKPVVQKSQASDDAEIF
jgi:hypothetical protein